MKSSVILSVEPEIKPLGLGGNFEENAKLIAGLGFDGAELLLINLENINTKWIKKITKQYQLTIPVIGSGRYYLSHGLSLATSDNEIRKNTLRRVKERLRIASELNSNIMIGAGQGDVERNYEESFNYLKDSLQECAKVAEEKGVFIFIELVNRYLRGAMIRTIEQGIRLVDEVASPSVKILADTHHMNIEERSLPDSIRRAKGYIAHMHFSDSNRLAPGQGHIDYFEIAEALRDIGYDGFASAEFLPEPDQLTATKQTIQLIKSLPY